MISLISGVGLIAAAVALVYPFVPRPGTESRRNEWIDISVAIAVSAGLAIGIGLIVIGVANFWG